MGTLAIIPVCPLSLCLLTLGSVPNWIPTTIGQRSISLLSLSQLLENFPSTQAPTLIAADPSAVHPRHPTTSFLLTEPIFVWALGKDLFILGSIFYDGFMTQVWLIRGSPGKLLMRIILPEKR